MSFLADVFDSWKVEEHVPIAVRIDQHFLECVDHLITALDLTVKLIFTSELSEDMCCEKTWCILCQKS